MRTRTLAPLLASVGLAACNAIVGNVDAISYVDDDASVSPGDGDAAGDDATEDGRPSDDGGAGDAGKDADAALLPDISVACDGATFCSTFDPPKDQPPFGWDDPGSTSVYVTDSTDFVSAPFSLKIDLPNNVAPRSLSTTISGQRPLTVIHDLFVRTSGGGEIGFLEVRCTLPSPTKLRAGIDQTGHMNLASEATSAKSGGPLVPEDTWLTVVMRMTTTETTLFMVQGGETTAMIVPETCEGPYEIRLGYPFTGTVFRPATWTTLFDDVKVTVTP